MSNKTVGHTGIARLCFALSGNRTRSPHQALAKWWEHVTAVGIQLDSGNEETLFERIAIYIKIMAELLKKKLVILVNSRSYLTSDQIDQIAELCMYSEVGLLLIENVQRDFSKKRNYCIIDCDECCIS